MSTRVPGVFVLLDVDTHVDTHVYTHAYMHAYMSTHITMHACTHVQHSKCPGVLDSHNGHYHTYVITAPSVTIALML